MKWAVPLITIGCINVESGKGHDTGRSFSINETTDSFLNDCGEPNNDEPQSANHFEGSVDEIELCERDVDFYTIDVEPGMWMSLTMYIDGSGHNGTDTTDLDLWELN